MNVRYKMNSSDTRGQFVHAQVDVVKSSLERSDSDATYDEEYESHRSTVERDLQILMTMSEEYEPLLDSVRSDNGPVSAYDALLDLISRMFVLVGTVQRNLRLSGQVTGYAWSNLEDFRQKLTRDTVSIESSLFHHRFEYAVQLYENIKHTMQKLTRNLFDAKDHIERYSSTKHQMDLSHLTSAVQQYIETLRTETDLLIEFSGLLDVLRSNVFLDATTMTRLSEMEAVVTEIAISVDQLRSTRTELLDGVSLLNGYDYREMDRIDRLFHGAR
jgi:hypothetical protein